MEQLEQQVQVTTLFHNTITIELRESARDERFTDCSQTQTAAADCDD
jgi:hypothetical protein